ncbi:unnamed protein product [Adineta ricciae]|uniref:Uncharacterized protein n=2 Tax=Adineta ricciae TaxID=249248 RepID=A0A815KIS8_ADIRI|nr:unnamed protein product [Adineta ricciae]
MGCAVGLLTTYSVEEVESEVAKLTPHLPMAELMNGGIIKLGGANGFFNPNSLLDPSWLKGKMTVEEYQQAINYINKCAAHSQIGLTKAYNTSEGPMRLNLRTQAGMRAVEEINQRHRGVRFTYQQTVQNLQMNVSWELDPTQKVMLAGRSPVGHATLTILYITIN